MRKIGLLNGLTFAVLILSVLPLHSGDNLGPERDKMRMMLNVVSKDIEKNFYDPSLKGLEWKAMTEQAKQKIDNAQSVADMKRAIFVLVEKLGDSHTRFLPPSMNVTYTFGFNAKPFGDEIRVYDMKEGGAAQLAGVKLGDRIVSVNGFRADRNIYDLMMWDFKVIRNAGELDIKIQTDDETPRTIHLEAVRKVKPVILDFVHGGDDIWDLIRELEKEEAWHYRSFKDGIGMAQIRGFLYDHEDFFNSLIEKSGAKKAIIIDMRSNGGGAQDTLKNFAGEFENEEVTMADLKGRKKDEKLIVKPRKPHYDMPMFILIDSETGSAAEMFAKHFQLRKKATVVGDRSSGRVTSSMFFDEETGANSVVPFGVQIGMSRVIFPDGIELEKRGVLPDVPCIPTGKDIREERDVCLMKAVALAREKLGLPVDRDLPEGKPAEVMH